MNLGEEDRERWIGYCDWGLEGIIGVLLFTLPMSNMRLIKGGGIILAALLWVTKGALSRRPIFKRTAADLPIALFFAWSCFTIATAVDPFYSFREVKNEILTQLFFFYLIVSNFEGRRIKRLLHYLFASAFLLSVIGIVEFFRMKGTFLTPTIRVGSLTEGYIYFSTYLVLTIPLILSAASSRARRGVFSLLSLLAFAALYFTFTRAAWLGVFAELLVYYFIQNRRFFWGLVAASTLGGLLLLFVAPRFPMAEQTISALSRTEDIPRRMAQWEFDLKAIREHPGVGVGYGREGLKKAYPSEVRVMNKQGGWWHAFNMFLGVAIGLGLPGLLLFLWLLSIFFREVWRYRGATDPDLSGLASAVLAIFVGYLVRNWFDHLYADAPALLFWILIAMVIAAGRREPSEARSESLSPVEPHQIVVENAS